MLLFAMLYFTSPKPTPGNIQRVTQIVTNTVTMINTVTNEVVKEVPKEVEKIVEVPAKIPQEYVAAMDLWQKMTNASFTPLEQVLFRMTNVNVICELDYAMQQVTSEDEVKAKFELTLRRNDVPIDPHSPNIVYLTITGFLDPATPTTLCYAILCRVAERQWIFRWGECHLATVIVWNKGQSHGTVGKYKANEALLKEIEKCAEIFANDYLSANPKPK